MPGKEWGHVYGSSPWGAEAADSCGDRRAGGQKRRERISQVDRGVEGTMRWWQGHADCMGRRFSLVLSGRIGAVQHCGRLCLLLGFVVFLKHEKSQRSVRETIQPRQKQALGSSSVLLLPQNPGQSQAMDSMYCIVIGDGCDVKCCMFSYLVLQVLLCSCIHCFLYFHQWLWSRRAGSSPSFSLVTHVLRGTWKGAAKRSWRELLPHFVQLRSGNIKTVCFPLCCK